MPYRIQLKRVKGWRMPEGAVSVARPGPWGNPFVVGEKFCNLGLSIALRGILTEKQITEWHANDGLDVPDAETAVRLFRDYAHWMLEHWLHWLDALRGKDLACWCDLSEPCHGDVLLELSNKEAEDANLP